jgi:Cu/Ag efflux protein CusF
MISRRSSRLTFLAAAVLAAACAGPAGERPAAGASPTNDPLVAPLGPGAVPSLSPTAAATQYDIRGKVESVATDRLAVTLDHEEIPGLMAAMKMEYRVSDASVLQGLKAGDRVQGRLEVRPGNEYVILRLERP